jgi:hypothetical protein
MRSVKVEHFGGSVEVADSAALDAVLGERHGDDANEYFLCGAEPYPLLALLVHGSVACLHYFPREDHPGFLSVGGGVAGEGRAFYTNKPTEVIEVPGDAVVSFEQARDAARDFLRDGVIPSSVRWIEL